MKKISRIINEKLKTVEVDDTKFPNQTGKSDPSFFKRGHTDGETKDDPVTTTRVKIAAKHLLASQDAVYLGKSLGMAVGGVEGGDLGSIVSKENRILDGHHRWAATCFNNPNAMIEASKSMMTIGDLVPVLRAAGDAMGNQRGVEPAGGDRNIFQATMADVKAAIFDGKWMDPQFYDREKSIAWFNRVGEATIAQRLALIQKAVPPKGAPARKDMPKIEPDQVDKVVTGLQNGDIDTRAPYANEDLILFKQKPKRKIMIQEDTTTPRSLRAFITESLGRRMVTFGIDWDWNKKQDESKRRLQVVADWSKVHDLLNSMSINTITASVVETDIKFLKALDQIGAQYYDLSMDELMKIPAPANVAKMTRETGSADQLGIYFSMYGDPKEVQRIIK